MTDKKTHIEERGYQPKKVHIGYQPKPAKAPIPPNVIPEKPKK